MLYVEAGCSRVSCVYDLAGILDAVLKFANDSSCDKLLYLINQV